MKGRYAIDGSNAGYLVWGILVLIFGGITAILCLISIITMISMPSSTAGRMLYSLSDDLAIYTVLSIIISFLTYTIQVAVKIATGVVLVRNYINSQVTLIFLAVLYFLSALAWAVLYAFAFAAGITVLEYSSGYVLAVVTVVFLIKFIWDLVTGALLILKSKKAVPMNRHSVGIQQWQPAGTAVAGTLTEASLVPQVIGTIEGMFGSYQGRIFELHKGEVYKIGRDLECNIQISHPKVSRIHCTVCKLQNGKYQITDHSSNGTFYENIRLQRNVATEVNPGGMLVIGEADNVFRLR